jgi:thiamine-phosphate pyrophosphorylase
MPPAIPPLYAIVDADVAAAHGWSVPDLACQYLAGGARLLQLRAKGASSGRLLALCEHVVAAARECGAMIVVNDRADVAWLAGAAGVHVGQEDLGVADVRRAFPGLAIVGISTHTRAQLAAAVREPATYIAVGPVFGTATKATGYDPVGLDLVGEARRAVRVADGGAERPVVAIGGITLARARSVIDAGAAAVAVISDLLVGGDPAARVRAYLDELAQIGGGVPEAGQ